MRAPSVISLKERLRGSFDMSCLGRRCPALRRTDRAGSSPATDSQCGEGGHRHLHLDGLMHSGRLRILPSCAPASHLHTRCGRQTQVRARTSFCPKYKLGEDVSASRAPGGDMAHLLGVGRVDAAVMWNVGMTARQTRADRKNSPFRPLVRDAVAPSDDRLPSTG
jgi:hypothetical protein